MPFADSCLGFSQFGQQRLAARQVRAAGLGQADPARAALKQAYPEPRLQCRNGAADGRDVDLQPFGGAYEAALVRDLDEGADLAQAIAHRLLRLLQQWFDELPVYRKSVWR
jgi:hypothetical protein